MTGHVTMILVTALLVVSGYDLFPMSMNQLPLDIRDDVDFLRYLAAREAAEHPDVAARQGGHYSSEQAQQVGHVCVEVTCLSAGWIMDI